MVTQLATYVTPGGARRPDSRNLRYTGEGFPSLKRSMTRRAQHLRAGPTSNEWPPFGNFVATRDRRQLARSGPSPRFAYVYRAVARAGALADEDRGLLVEGIADLVVQADIIPVLLESARPVPRPHPRDPAGGTQPMADQSELEATIRALVQRGKGILAADESSPTIAKRFKSIGVESTEENRRVYREFLLATPGLGDYISGVIFFEETLGQRTGDGTPLPQLAARQGIVPGIKVDAGKIPLAHAPGDEITEGLDGLAKRLDAYKQQGARFANGAPSTTYPARCRAGWRSRPTPKRSRATPRSARIRTSFRSLNPRS